MADATTKPGRVPNTQPNAFVPGLAVEIFLDGEALGALQVPQAANLSKSGNVLFYGAIKRGWQLPGEATDVLPRLTFKVNGVDAALSAQGLHLSAPRTRKDGTVIPNSGNEPMVTHWAIVDTAKGDETEEHMVLVIVKRLHPKNGKDQGFSLRVQSAPRALGRAAGPQVVGDFEGLLVVS